VPLLQGGRVSEPWRPKAAQIGWGGLRRPAVGVGWVPGALGLRLAAAGTRPADGRGGPRGFPVAALRRASVMGQHLHGCPAGSTMPPPPSLQAGVPRRAACCSSSHNSKARACRPQQPTDHHQLSTMDRHEQELG
jgi:hypothetical protein